jgi:hypothetical protein
MGAVGVGSRTRAVGGGGQIVYKVEDVAHFFTPIDLLEHIDRVCF